MTLFPARWVVNRPLDLGRIDAVGFDLDHTLALYDDAAVNALAMAEAQALLVARRGYREGDVDVAPRPGDAIAARALALDLTRAHVIKLDADRRVRVARRGGVWLADHEIARAHADHVPEHDDAVHPLSSPFDVPTLWLFEAITRARLRASADDTHGVETFDPARACKDAREMLDYSHTRGALKRRLLDDLTRFVSPVSGARERLVEWRRAGKKLFVVTNSDPAYALEVLGVAIGPRWREIFDLVSTSSAKPAFFDRGAPRAVPAPSAPGAPAVIEGAHASEVEARLGVRGERVLYAGDNARADIAAARWFGWRTAHVVAEMGNSPISDPDGWGSPFAVGNEATWFARVIRATADLVCDRIDRLLALEPDGRIDGESRGAPAAGESA